MNKHPAKQADSKPQPVLTRECTIPRDYRVPICNQFADLLIQERKKRDLTPYALAKYAHVDKRTIEFIEARVNGVTLDKACRLLDVFGMRFTIVRERPDRSI